MGFFDDKTEINKGTLIYLIVAISSFFLLIGALFQEIVTNLSYIILLILLTTTFLTIKSFIQKK
jgi:hypothetical protein